MINQPIYVIGGGPSLRGFDLQRLRNKRCIAVNAAVFDAPWAEICFFGDGYFYRHYGVRLQREYSGRTITTWYGGPNMPNVERWTRDQSRPFSSVSGILAGDCSGSQAFNLACQLTTGPIALLGFDMKPNGYYHSHYNTDERQGRYEKILIAFERMSTAATMMGIKAYNACPDSRAEVLPKLTLDDAVKFL